MVKQGWLKSRKTGGTKVLLSLRVQVAEASEKKDEGEEEKNRKRERRRERERDEGRLELTSSTPLVLSSKGERR
uniref:Uncharacterized protein n=1 Tax=Nelumbo nucifera TaxID=4432 RepID=A0A822XW38_NELNU|nr:TPA_asm: hypothetical protein HUJ06_024679 [Nelumbo nucifera]